MSSKSDSGSVLPSVLLTGFLLMSLLIGILTVISFDNNLDCKRLRKKKLDLVCYSAVQQNISRHGDIFSGQSYTTRIDSTDVTVTSRLKGLFCLVSAKSKNAKDSSELRCLFAQSLSPEFENALVFSKPDVHPVVAGDTKIKGDILMSGKVITPGNIFGLRNTANDYHSGIIHNQTEINAFLMSGKVKTPGNIFGLRNTANDYHNGIIRNQTEISGKLFRDTLLKQLFRFTQKAVV